MKRVDVVYVLIYDEETEKVLMVENRRGETSDFTLPGGGVENGETLEQAAIREVKEETGYDIEVGGIVAVREVFRSVKGHHAVFFTFLGKITGGEISLSRPDEIVDIQWVDLNNADRWMKVIPGGVSKLLQSQSSALYHFQGHI